MLKNLTLKIPHPVSLALVKVISLAPLAVTWKQHRRGENPSNPPFLLFQTMVYTYVVSIDHAMIYESFFGLFDHPYNHFCDHI